MNRPLTARRHEFNNYMEMLEQFYERRWTDGHPIVPPTESLVQKFLDYVMIEPDAVIADCRDRNRRVTAEAVAINAVMAGCKPEYMPILFAGVKALLHPDFKFNHIACLRSGYPNFIISGPIVKELGINHGIWAWGAGDRGTSTIGRAFSLILWNLLEVKPGEIQRGVHGQPGRWANTIAENPDSPWETLNVTEGFNKKASTITANSFHAYLGGRRVHFVEPEVILEMIMTDIANAWSRACYLIQVSPALAKIFADRGWTKDRVHKHLLDNTWSSVARLKRLGLYLSEAQGGYAGDEATTKALKILPGDETTRVYLFKENAPELESLVFGRSMLNRFRTDIMLVVNGGDTGADFIWRSPHGIMSPVTMPIERPGC